ncbi:MAG: DUF1330 domain-containing protein [Deltaproteobacteria bacterium]|nr:DUF1330 domain-containing protein [Deltaproteobacteria bacterium]
MRTINPEPGQLQKALSNVPSGKPVVMLNLLKFRDKALYEDGVSEISGRKAYAIYSEGAIKHIQRVGAKLIWSAEVKAPIICPEHEEWDQVLLVIYPSMEKFLEMVNDPEYQKIAIHRTAALEDSRLITTVEQVRNL